MTALGVWVVENTPESVHSTLAAIKTRLAQCPQIEDLELALAEALNNLVDHGYDGHGFGRISLAQTAQGGVHCRLEDYGRAYCPPKNPSVGVAKVRGHGWPIIRGLAQSVALQRSDGKNTLSLEF